MRKIFAHTHYYGFFNMLHYTWVCSIYASVTHLSVCHSISDRYLTSSGGNISLTQTCFRDHVFHSLVTSCLIVISPCSVTSPAWTQMCRRMLPFSSWWTVMRARSHQPPGQGPLVAHAARGSTTSKMLTLDRCQQYGDLRLLEVTEERNGPSGLRDDDDDDSITMATFQVRLS